MSVPSSTNPLTDLARRAAQGDAGARAALLEAAYPRVRAMVHRELELDFRRNHRWILPLFSTGDIVHNVFEGVLASLDSCASEDDAALLRFLAALVKHRLIDAVRHHEAERRDPRRAQGLETAGGGLVAAVGDDPTPSMHAALGEQVRIFQEVLDSFPARERALLEMRLVEDKPWDEVATALGWPSGNAALKAFRGAKARLLIRLRARGIEAPGDGS